MWVFQFTLEHSEVADQRPRSGQSHPQFLMDAIARDVHAEAGGADAGLAVVV